MPGETRRKVKSVLFITMLVAAEVQRVRGHAVCMGSVIDALFERLRPRRFFEQALGRRRLLFRHAGLENTTLGKLTKQEHSAGPISTGPEAQIFGLTQRTDPSPDPVGWADRVETQIFGQVQRPVPLATPSPLPSGWADYLEAQAFGPKVRPAPVQPDLPDPWNLQRRNRTAELVSISSAKFPVVSALTFTAALMQINQITSVNPATLPLEYLVAPALALSAVLGIFTTIYSLVETKYITLTLGRGGLQEELNNILEKFSPLRVAARDSMWASVALLLAADAIRLRRLSLLATLIMFAGMVGMAWVLYKFRAAYVPLLGTTAEFIPPAKEDPDQ